MSRKPTPRSIPPDRLRAMSEHLLYEIEMFAYTTDLLTPEIWRDVPAFMVQGAHNALIESFTIHVRALHDFLYAKPRAGDASAADYFPDGEWRNSAGPSRRYSSRRAGEPGRRSRTSRTRAWDGRATASSGRTARSWRRSAPASSPSSAGSTAAWSATGVWPRAWSSILTAASVPQRARYGEPRTVAPVATQAFGMPS
jgi:hypothetical protein